MQASDVMTTGAATIRPDAPIEKAARLMLTHRISGLPVIDDAGKLVGMVTEGDLLRGPANGNGGERPGRLEMLLGSTKSDERRPLPTLANVADVMSRPPITASADTPVHEVVAILQRHGIKRVPVVKEGRVVGIVSRADLLRQLARLAEEMPSANAEDRALRQRVVDRLEREPRPAWASVNVLVRQGLVELRGATSDPDLRARLVAAAQAVPGVKSLDDRMVVVGPASGRAGTA
jgi:CBS domain-containing protein